MKTTGGFTIKPRLLALQAVMALLVLGLVISYRQGMYSIPAFELSEEQSLEPAKMYNEDLLEWFGIEFLPSVIEEPELTAILDAHTVSEDEDYHQSRKATVYDIFGPLIASSGGENEHRYYISKSGDKGHGVYANEFMPKYTLIGVYTGIRTSTSEDTTYEWNYLSTPIVDDEELPIGLDGREAGNMLRFINDGKNLNIRMVSVAWNNRWYTIYSASKDIHVGEELMVSYGSGYWEEREFLV
jgi:hypothetical protein